MQYSDTHTSKIPMHMINLLKKNKREWWDGSEVKSTGCSSRDPEFSSQQPHGDSLSSVMRSDAIFCHAGAHAGKTLYT